MSPLHSYTNSYTHRFWRVGTRTARQLHGKHKTAGHSYTPDYTHYTAPATRFPPPLKRGGNASRPPTTPGEGAWKGAQPPTPGRAAASSPANRTRPNAAPPPPAHTPPHRPNAEGETT